MNKVRSSHILILAILMIFTACQNGEEQNTADSTTADKKIPSGSGGQISQQDLMSASLEGNIQIFKKAVEQGIEIDRPDQSGRTPLMMAAFNGHTALVRYFLEQDAELNVADREGRTPLIFAASGPNPETVALLLANGADPNATDGQEGWSALMWSAAEGNEKVVQALLAHGADPHMQDRDGETARDFATQNGHDRVARLLAQAEDKN